MAQQITISAVAEHLGALTGVPVGELAEVHITGGLITFITAEHPATGTQMVGHVHIVPDEEPREDGDTEEADDYIDRLYDGEF